MAGKKSACPECGEKLRIPDESEKIAPVDINPRMSDVYDLIDSISSLDFCKEAMTIQVQRFNQMVETIKLKNMQMEARDNLGMKLQAELWEHEAARCEIADTMNELKRENRSLRQQVIKADSAKVTWPEKGMSVSSKVGVESQELERLENINRAQADQIGAVSRQLEGQQEELQQLRLSQGESQEKRDRLCEEIARLNRIVTDLSGRLQGDDKITRIAIA
jgi:chromosome segregation ATPase